METEIVTIDLSMLTSEFERIVEVLTEIMLKGMAVAFGVLAMIIVVKLSRTYILNLMSQNIPK